MATKANITIDQGTDFSTSISLTDEFGNDLNLTGYTAKAQLRRWYTSSTAVTFTTTLVNGSVVISLSAAVTNTLTDRYVYDVILKKTSDNTITRIVEGLITINPRVTVPS